MSSLTTLNDDPAFAETRTATAVLDAGRTIMAVNPAYLGLTLRRQDDLIGAPLLEAFPAPPDPTHRGHTELDRSLTTALTQARQVDMRLTRYDIQDPRDGAWLRRYWACVVDPVLRDGEVAGLRIRLEDVTPADENLAQVLELYTELLADGATSDAQAGRLAEAARAFVTAARESRRLAQEVGQLRTALTSRATIDQAKGIVMAERGGSPDEAFALLKQMSSETNVRLADVAAALVYRAQQRGLGG
jgi:hypothetical protein